MATVEIREKDRVLSDVPGINQLPSELLAKIFVLVEKTYRHARLTSDAYVGFQDTATQVCRYWRETAILTQELWTYIFISSPDSHEQAQLYLARSGTRLLHVDLVIHPPDIEGLESLAEGNQVIQMLEMVKSVFSSVGGLDRWSSLVLFAGFPVVFFEAMEQINARPTPNLRFVSFESRPSNISRRIATVDPSHTPGLGPRHPMLGTVQLRGLPSHFIFDHPELLVSGLRRLGLACDHAFFPLHRLGSLLGACTQLESLSLDMSSARTINLGNLLTGYLFLPSLRFFSLDIAHSTSACGLRVLQMVDAPGVEIFQLGFEISQQTIIGDAPANGAPTNEILQSFFQSLLQIGGPAPHTTGAFFPQSGKAALARFISSGRLNGALQKTSATGQPGAGPLFPSLCTLALPDLSSDDAIYADLLGAYAGVTKVTLSTSGVKFLSHEDRFLPRLTHLRCLNDEDPASMAVIKEAVEKRKDWGMGLSLLELVSTDSEPEGRKPMEETEKDFGNALDGLVVRKIMDWRFGWLGVYDIEDCIPT